jgi:hypothetical protein
MFAHRRRTLLPSCSTLLRSRLARLLVLPRWQLPAVLWGSITLRLLQLPLLLLQLPLLKCRSWHVVLPSYSGSA